MATKELSNRTLQQAVEAFTSAAGNISQAAALLGLPRGTLQGRLAAAKRAGITVPEFQDEDAGYIDARREQVARQNQTKTVRKLGNRVMQLEDELAAALFLRDNLSSYKIVANPAWRSEATAIWEASDWHVGEKVTKGQTNGINEYNPDIAKKRAEQFFVNGLRLTKMMGRDVAIKTVVLAALGDFMTGHLHDQNAETNYFAPVEEALYAQNLLASGIKYVMERSSYQLVVVCHSGNHARTTRFAEFGSENGHSYEYFMYCALRNLFKDEARVTFVISEGAHTYLDVYSRPIRFMHGHDVKYGGGVGGLTVPLNKAIAQWDRARPAFLTCLGHFHQRLDGGNFLANGSLIGYNAFALSIKASAEPPAQQMCLIDRDRGKTIVAPILFDV